MLRVGAKVICHSVDLQFQKLLHHVSLVWEWNALDYFVKPHGELQKCSYLIVEAWSLQVYENGRISIVGKQLLWPATR